ncbi:maleylpyruvate isomerase family mycothiol-dependent enzyme [Cryptosporangium aurantiacum]|uniref:TIGR03083 family protein n=1 Tax=Cryptosporangium aurantiacum TaxID=134849 RepID=A0A1M7RB98_9ACTN|nr:maleylpyruvate isomerase family mycothiol-dependent enzyme [Cryptosporangium aurantiacum]SHN43595.1 TIGR03083 family protein [Cryptosporangium aurantiacum]
MSTPDAEALTRIAALRASHDRLRAVAAPLTPDQVRRPGYPSEWTIAQVLSHLGSGAEINGLIFDAGVAGTDPPKQEDFQAIWAVWDAKTPDAQAADVLTADARLVEKIEALDADQRASATFAVWSGPTDIAGFVSSRLSEHAVHVWDVEVMLDPSATVHPAAVGLVLDVAQKLVGFAGKPGPAGRIHVTVTDPDREYALVLGDAVALEPWGGGESTGSLELPAEAFLRLLYGRLDPAHSPSVTAENVDLDALRAVFPGF